MARSKFRSARVAPAAAPRSRRRSFSLGRLMFFLLVLFLIAAWFAPTIVVRTPLRDSLTARATAGFPGKIQFASASAGWLSPVSIKNVQVSDAEGETVAVIASISTEKNLVSLLLEPQNLGTIHVMAPQLNIIARDNGSNVEDLLATWLAKPSTGPRSACVVDVADGAIAIHHVPSASKWSFEKLKARVAVPNNALPLVAALSVESTGNPQSPGSLACDVQWSLESPAGGVDRRPQQLPATAPAPATNTVHVKSSAFPLDSFNPWLRRFGLDVQFSGRLTSEMALAQTPSALTASLKNVAADQFFLASPKYLGRDQIQFASLICHGELVHSNGFCQLRGLTAKSDVGSLEIDGSAPTHDKTAAAAGVLSVVSGFRGVVKGNLDVARLAAVVPHTLRLREGTHVSGGKIVLDIKSEPQPAGHVWNVDVNASDIAALHEGRAIQWRRPIVIKSMLSQSANGLSIDQLACDSSFLQLTGQGTWSKGQVTANCDLDQLIREIGEFIDWGSFHAAGRVNGRLAWNHDGNQMASIVGDASARDFELTSASLRPWREPQLQLDFSATAKTRERTISSLEQADIAIKAAGDTLVAELRQAVERPSLDASWPVHFKLYGDLGQWLARMQMFATFPNWTIDGEGTEIKGDATISPQRIEIAAAEGSVNNLQVWGGGFFVREPAVQFTTSLAYDLARREFLSAQTTLSGTTVALRANDVRLSLGGTSPSADGTIQYRTDLGRLATWTYDPQLPPQYRLAGAATGRIQLTHEGNITKSEISSDIEGFSYAVPAASSPRGFTATSSAGAPASAPWRELWQEPRLQWNLQAAYDSQANLVQVTKLEAAGESISLGAVGSIRDPFTTCDVELAGQYAYDLQRLSQRLEGIVGRGLRMSGTDAKPFSVRGPLLAKQSPPIRRPADNTAAIATPAPGSTEAGSPRIRDILAQANVGWQSLAYQGFEIGPGELQTQLENGILTIAPFELPVSSGTMRLSPRVDLARDPVTVELPPGRIVEQVRISPEMCRTWLKYIAPLVADATAAEGQLSVQLDRAAFPAKEPMNGQVKGQLVVHNAQIGPGPLAEELIVLAQQIKSIIERRPLDAATSTKRQWLEMPPQETEFELADQRVYHRGLQLAVQDISIRTQGWVGIDQTLAMYAEVPIRDEWLGNDRYLATLKGQTIKLPVSGTLTRPQIDRRALTELTAQTVRDAGTNFIQDQLNRGLERGLDRLFPVKPPQNPPPQ